MHISSSARKPKPVAVTASAVSPGIVTRKNVTRKDGCSRPALTDFVPVPCCGSCMAQRGLTSPKEKEIPYGLRGRS